MTVRDYWILGPGFSVIRSDSDEIPGNLGVCQRSCRGLQTCRWQKTNVIKQEIAKKVARKNISLNAHALDMPWVSI